MATLINSYRIAISIILLLPLTANASKIVMEGNFPTLTCSSVMYMPTGDQFETHDFEKNYFKDSKFSITQDNDGFKMTTDLYSGQFVAVNSSSNKFVFVQSYNNGTEIATIILNRGVVTYTNTSGEFYNRLCVGKISKELNAN